MTGYSSDIGQLPPAADILNALGSLREPLKKMMYHDMAAAMWPQHERYIRMSKQQFDQEAAQSANMAGAAPAAGQPTIQETLGIKWAAAIECYVDEDATDGQIGMIRSEGSSQVTRRIGGLMHRYANLLSDTRLAAADRIAARMTKVQEQFREFVDSGGNGRFATLEEGTSEEQWKGEDAKEVREQYSETLERAATNHYNMSSHLTNAVATALAQECRDIRNSQQR